MESEQSSGDEDIVIGYQPDGTPVTRADVIARCGEVPPSKKVSTLPPDKLRVWDENNPDDVKERQRLWDVFLAATAEEIQPKQD